MREGAWYAGMKVMDAFILTTVVIETSRRRFRAVIWAFCVGLSQPGASFHVGLKTSERGYPGAFSKRGGTREVSLCASGGEVRALLGSNEYLL